MSAWDMRVLLALRRGGPPYAMRPRPLRGAPRDLGAVTKQSTGCNGAGCQAPARPGPWRRLSRAAHDRAWRWWTPPSSCWPRLGDPASDVEIHKREREAAARFCLKAIALLEPAGRQRPRQAKEGARRAARAQK